MHHHLLFDIGVAVVSATVLGLLAHWLRQPILLGYLLAGAVVGPEIGFGIIQERDSIEVISEIGLVLLLFIIGLELNIKSLLSSGRQLIVGGFGQFPICVLLGMGVFVLLGYSLGGDATAGGDGAAGLYLAICCALSSTAIVVKLLYDKGEMDTLPGRLTLGILVVQDIYAIFVLALQPNFGSFAVAPVARAIVGTVALLALGLLFSRYALQRVFDSIAKNAEMVLAVSLGWCAVVAAAAAALNLSKEMGALVAGLSISAFPYSIHVTAKTLPLRDFFLTLFFVSLGMKIGVPTWELAGAVVAVVACNIGSRFLSVYPLLLATGAGKRAAFIASLNLAQVSEFSLVIAAIGASTEFQHIGDNVVMILLYAMAITAVVSSYAIRFSDPLFRRFDRLTGGSGQPDAGRRDDGREVDIVLLGCHRIGKALVDSLRRTHPEMLGRIVVVDFNPVMLDELKGVGVQGVFGDIGSLETLQHAHIGHARMVLSTIPDMLLKGVDNAGLVRLARSVAPQALIVAIGDDELHAQRLLGEGADRVVRPAELTSESIARLVVGEVA
jgi:Kef-type K+ transport system membrane component KefB